MPAGAAMQGMLRAPPSSSSAIWKSASRRKMARALGTSVRSTVAAPAARRSALPRNYISAPL